MVIGDNVKRIHLTLQERSDLRVALFLAIHCDPDCPDMGSMRALWKRLRDLDPADDRLSARALMAGTLQVIEA